MWAGVVENNEILWSWLWARTTPAGVPELITESDVLEGVLSEIVPVPFLPVITRQVNFSDDWTSTNLHTV